MFIYDHIRIRSILLQSVVEKNAYAPLRPPSYIFLPIKIMAQFAKLARWSHQRAPHGQTPTLLVSIKLGCKWCKSLQNSRFFKAFKFYSEDRCSGIHLKHYFKCSRTGDHPRSFFSLVLVLRYCGFPFINSYLCIDFYAQYLFDQGLYCKTFTGVINFVVLYATRGQCCKTSFPHNLRNSVISESVCPMQALLM